MSKAFICGVASVLTGALAAQLIPIAGTLVLARIFDPASFGIFSAWIGGVLFLGVVLTCRFEMSLAVEEDGPSRRTAVVMTLITIILMSMIASGLVLLAVLFFRLEWVTRLPLTLLVSAVPTAALVAATQTFQNWAAADGRYRDLTVMRIAQASSIVLLQIGFGMVWSDAVGLGVGYLAGAFLGLVVAVNVAPLQGVRLIHLGRGLGVFWRTHRRFAMYSLPADAVSAAAAQLPLLVVAVRFGSEAAGLLAMAMRMLGAPMSLLASSVLDVFKRHAGQAYRERGECRTEYLHAFRILFLVAVTATVVIALGAEPVFAAVFGEVWLGAGTMALWLLPRFAIGFVSSPLSYMVYIAGKQQLDLIWQLALLAMTLATLLLFDSVQWALVSYGLGYGVLYLVYLAMSYQFSLGSRR